MLDLTTLKEQLIAPQILFMLLHEHPRGGQFSIHGNFVNVPTDVNTTVNSLPQNLDDAETVPLKLKRKLCCNKSNQFELVRPVKVLKDC